MVDVIQPKPKETVCDPACGTGGILLASHDYVVKHNPNMSADEKRKLKGSTFKGWELVQSTARLCAMNLMLHDVANPHLYYQDTLSRGFREKRPELAENHFDVILANPPFKGSLDAEDVDPTLTAKVKTKKTELLFLVLMLRMLKNPGGKYLL